MGKVQVTYRIIPDGADVDLKVLRANLEKVADVRDCKEEPIAFGLKALVVVFHVPDDAGGTDALENKLNSVAGVGGVECTDLCRL